MRDQRLTAGPQISMGMLLLVMLVFGLVSAGLLYASRVPEVQREWAMLTGKEISGVGSIEEGRTRHLIFILFTFTSPLLMAGSLSLGLAMIRFWNRPRPVVRRVVGTESVDEVKQPPAPRRV